MLWIWWIHIWFTPVAAFLWFCHHTYHALSPPAAGYGGCVDEVPSGLGGVEDQRLIYEFAKQLGFLTMGGGGHTHQCFDVLCLCLQNGRCSLAVVLDNGYPGDVSVPVYAALTQRTNIGPNCENAADDLPIRSYTPITNMKEQYRQWVSFSEELSQDFLSFLSCPSSYISNGTTSLSITTLQKTTCFDGYSTWVR